MHALHELVGLVVVTLVFYLVAALLFPERFK